MELDLKNELNLNYLFLSLTHCLTCTLASYACVLFTFQHHVMRDNLPVAITYAFHPRASVTDLITAEIILTKLVASVSSISNIVSDSLNKL